MMGENPFLSDPNVNKVRKALAALEFLVVQDIFLTETAEFADVVLPATSFMEKDGHVHEHRPARADRPQGARPARPRRAPDWEIVCDIANRIGLPMEYASVSEVFDEMVALSPAYAGLRLRQPRAGGQALSQPGPRALRRHRRAVRRVVRDRRRQGAPRARRVDAGQGAARRGVPVRAQHRPAARALAHRLDDAALVRARRDPAHRDGLRRPTTTRRGWGSPTATSCA